MQAVLRIPWTRPNTGGWSGIASVVRTKTCPSPFLTIHQSRQKYSPLQSKRSGSPSRFGHSSRRLVREWGCRFGSPADRADVLAGWRCDHPPILARLPLNYDDTRLKTIEQIDVLWLHGRSIKGVFEVEHTTSIYSG